MSHPTWVNVRSNGCVEYPGLSRLYSYAEEKMKWMNLFISLFFFSCFLAVCGWGGDDGNGKEAITNGIVIYS